MNLSLSRSAIAMLADWQVNGIGDFDGDQRADILRYHPASGTVAFWLMNGTTISSVGVVGSIPTDWQVKGVGDFNNDEKSDVLWQHTSGLNPLFYRSQKILDKIFHRT